MEREIKEVETGGAGEERRQEQMIVEGFRRFIHCYV